MFCSFCQISFIYIDTNQAQSYWDKFMYPHNLKDDIKEIIQGLISCYLPNQLKDKTIEQTQVT
ncbi:hypothetical protein pb186bvf_018237 [Paramecium bursaria]